MAAGDIDPAQLDRLRARGPRFAVAPGEPEWDASRVAFNLAIDQRPALIVFPESVGDVVAAIGFARANGLRVGPQRTGHSAEAIAPLADTMLLRTDRLATVELDAERRTARVGGGAIWADVVDVATPHGLAPLAGSSRQVGVAGYVVGGGLSVISRRFGLAANNVRAFELVTADGALVRTTADEEPELFWALRGGGGSFGVVTAVEIDLVEAPAVYAGNLLYPIERAREVLHSWREATLTAPEELTLAGRVLRIPDVAGRPPALRGRAFAVVDAVFLGDEAGGSELLAPLRALGPEIDTVAPATAEAIVGVHMDPDEPGAAIDDHALLGPLGPAAIDAFVDAVGPDSGTTLAAAELRQTGGALARAPEGAGALATLPGDYFAFAIGALTGSHTAEALRADLDRVLDAVGPYRVGEYYNFSDRPIPVSTFFSADVVERLRAVKRAWDPGDLIVSTHPVD